MGDRVTASAEKYRKGRAALVALKGDGYAPHFRPLHETDIRLEGDNGESDAAAKKKLAMISAGRGARAPRTAPGQSKRTMSWIWTVKAGLGDAERDLHDCESSFLLSSIVILRPDAILQLCVSSGRERRRVRRAGSRR